MLLCIFPVLLWHLCKFPHVGWRQVGFFFFSLPLFLRFIFGHFAFIDSDSREKDRKGEGQRRERDDMQQESSVLTRGFAGATGAQNDSLRLV